MSFYGFARTNNQKGITIPAQRTFIYYWHKILKLTEKYDNPEQVERRSSLLGDAGDAAVKAAILAATDEHLKEGGEEDDSESDPENDAGEDWVDPSIAEQVAQLDALKAAGHLSEVEYEEAKRHVVAAQAASAAKQKTTTNKKKSSRKSKRGSATPSSAAAEDSPDEEEEEDDDDKSTTSTTSMFRKFGFGSKKKGPAKVPDRAIGKEENSLMDRSWNDRNRAEA
jgi:hypothetical protein